MTEASTHVVAAKNTADRPTSSVAASAVHAAGAVTQAVQADLNGDGHLFVVQGLSDCSTQVIDTVTGATVWSTPNWIDGWNRRPWDIFVAIDIDGDGREEVFIANNRDGWTGMLKWSQQALHCPWGSPSPLKGPAGDWNRRGSDTFTAVSWKGAPAIAVAHTSDGWYGVLAWLGDAIGPVQILQNPPGPIYANPVGVPLRRFGLGNWNGSLPAFEVPASAAITEVVLHEDSGVSAGSALLAHNDAPTGFAVTGRDTATAAFNGMTPVGSWSLNVTGSGLTDTGFGLLVFWQ
jgi:hypothetical protein